MVIPRIGTLRRFCYNQIVARRNTDKEEMTMLFDLAWNGFKYTVIWPAILALKPFMPW